MTIQELITRLQEYPPDALVRVYEEGPFMSPLGSHGGIAVETQDGKELGFVDTPNSY